MLNSSKDATTAVTVNVPELARSVIWDLWESPVSVTTNLAMMLESRGRASIPALFQGLGFD